GPCRPLGRSDPTVNRTRREFIRDLGISAAALPFVLNLPSLGFANQQRRKQRLVILFSPDGVVPSTFWPDYEGKLAALPESLKPLDPIDNPYQMLAKIYGRTKDRESLRSVLDDVQDDLRKVGERVSAEDRRLLDEHASFVREMEQELKAGADASVGHAVPQLEP